MVEIPCASLEWNVAMGSQNPLVALISDDRMQQQHMGLKYNWG
jgi:hypothetical protein